MAVQKQKVSHARHVAITPYSESIALSSTMHCPACFSHACSCDFQRLENAGKLHAVKLDEAAKLLKYYAIKIQGARAVFRLPRKVAGAAINYLQRLYLHFSVLDRDPADMFICCLYLACKVVPLLLSLLKVHVWQAS